ncbi:hypothetical protein [Neobacillus sp. PS3-40]|uniref:hypothetical protein n=1 Tax=Neobacillus sp. PS3-40 TaxID=3070679 RepID=UPI0027DF2AE0|nr:hypothetical protein [Neobacillus sp. PS3-40]WML42872.1 hypothetical protein RCG20_13645 [Neobacillus sp. PS3-40]
MNPYPYYIPQSYFPYDIQAEQYDPNRQKPKSKGIEGRVDVLERQNDQQRKELARLNEELNRQNQEIHRLNGEINRLNQEILRLNNTNEKQTRHLKKLNQRLRIVENRLSIPYSPSQDEF